MGTKLKEQGKRRQKTIEDKSGDREIIIFRIKKLKGVKDGN
jgi:hypothetical protein